MDTFIDTLNHVMKNTEIVDLSHTLEVGMPAWPTQARFGSVIYESYDYGDAGLHSAVTMSEHTGTHIDAPRHFMKEGAAVDQLPMNAVMGRCVMVEASHLAPCRAFSLEELIAFETKYGGVEKGDIVLFRFGWENRYALRPDGGSFIKDWPGLSGEAASRLLHAGVKAVGTDAMSLDAFGAGNACHHLLLGAGIPILENVCNLARLPVHSYIIGLPNKFKDGSGSPIRLAAFIGR